MVGGKGGIGIGPWSLFKPLDLRVGFNGEISHKLLEEHSLRVTQLELSQRVFLLIWPLRSRSEPGTGLYCSRQHMFLMQNNLGRRQRFKSIWFHTHLCCKWGERC